MRRARDGVCLNIIIKKDWELINQKIKDGKAHELSEGDTFYLGACTKGSTAAKSLRKQPFNEIKAKSAGITITYLDLNKNFSKFIT